MVEQAREQLVDKVCVRAATGEAIRRMSIRRGRNTVCQWSARQKIWCYNYAHGIADNNNVPLISQEVLDSGDLACLGCVSQLEDL